MVTGDEIELFVNRLVPGGEGLAEVAGLKVFVPYAAPEERIRARVVKRKSDYAVAEIIQVVEPSPLRTEPRCKYYGQCGGCQLQHISYPGQLVIKKLLLNDALQRIGKIFVPVTNIAYKSSQWRYRNKTQYPVTQNTNDLKIGFYERRSHNLVSIAECFLHPNKFDQIRLEALKLFKGENGYDEKRHQGNIRHLVLRQGKEDEITVIVVTRTKKLPAKLAALADIPGVKSVVQNINPEKTNRIFGKETKILFGSGFVKKVVLGREFRVSPTSFFQVNIPQAEELCRKVINAVAPTGTESVLDLYSGVGMLSLILSGMVRKVTGVEIDPIAVSDARINTEWQGVKNAVFLEGDVKNLIGELNCFDVVVLDPPRKGCDIATLSRIAALKPRTVVYVSCNPATLARDLAILEEKGYLCERVEPVDMFPQTSHIETVATLQRKI
ncbi:MAG: 23S rRNA (uracil(1939)-C(5))-methyltransferase RlmD [candidate division WOR-3 bacterium]